MIDAYTIGIRIALEDGVSAGIASIEAQLSILDRAIGNTEAGLARIVDLGRRVGLASRASEPRTDLTAKSPQPAAKRPPLPGPPASEPDEFPVPRPAQKTIRIAAPPGPQSMLANSRPGDRPAAVTPALGPVSAQSPSPAKPAPIPLQRFAEPISSAEPIQGTKPTLPRYRAASRSADGEADIPPAAFAPAVGEENAPLAAEQTVFNGSSHPEELPFNSRAHLKHHPEAEVIIRQGDSPPPVSKAIAPLPRSETPEPNVKAAAPIATAPNSPKQPVVPSENQPLAGELYLDGTQLGHWMTDSFESAVSRPPSGTTGFDPRVSPSWPGLPGN